ncbi:hypothetical protein MTBLM1_20473 [Rhodospirillaceae bacterium LM-1]|nr:hypothetical protein MTBLM1_20473 [Rhodospirillaceae bacterium LM-1]
MTSKPKNGLQRGTTGYAINFFRSDILVNLQLDLKRLERNGFSEDICSKVKVLLSALVSAASAQPKGSFWGKAIHEILREYETTYKQWNDVSGHDQEAIARRDGYLTSLQDIRHSFANACRKNTFQLSEAHDLALIQAINDALVDTINLVPGTFTALTKSAKRFADRAIAP